MNKTSLAVALTFAVGASFAQAADLAPPSPVAAPPVAQGCDFFEAQLISYLCGHTAFVSASGDFYDYTRNNSFGVANPAGVVGQHFESRQAEEGATVSVTPWEGLRISLSDEALQYDDRSTQQFFPANGKPDTPAFGDASGSQNGWLALGAEYTLWDVHGDTGRYIFNLSGSLERSGGGGPYATRDQQAVGWNSGAKWTLAPGYSLNYDSTTLLRRFDNPGIVQVGSVSRLLVAADDWGVAIGPRLQTTSVLWHAAGVNTGWNEAALGGEALLAPFRSTRIAGLKDMVFDAYAQRSVGQAGLTPTWLGSTRSYGYGASARFNIRY